MLRVLAVHDEDPTGRAAYAPMIERPRPLSSIASAALDNPVLLPTVDLDELAKSLPDDSAQSLRSVGVRGLLVVPLRSRGRLLGLLSVLRHRADLPPLDETDREIVQHLANHAALALGIALLAHEQQELATEVAASRFLDAVIENIP